MVAELCKCGHGLAAHSGSGVAGAPCKVCGAFPQRVWPGKCRGWDPATRGGEADAGQRLDALPESQGADVTGPAGATTPPEPPAGPPDYVATQQTLRGFARYAADWLKPKMPDGYEMPFSLIQLRTALLAGADALEQLRPTVGPPDLDHAIQAAAKALLPWADDEDAHALFEWHHCDGCPSRGGPCACSGQPWPSAAVQAAITAAWPLLERDLRAAQTKLQEYEHAIDWAVTCTACAKVLDASIAEHERAEQAADQLRVAQTQTDQLRKVAEAVRKTDYIGAHQALDILDQAAPEQEGG